MQIYCCLKEHAAHVHISALQTHPPKLTYHIYIKYMLSDMRL